MSFSPLQARASPPYNGSPTAYPSFLQMKSIRWGPVCAETPTAWRQKPPQRVANARSGLSHQGRRRETQSASPLYARRILGGRQPNAIGSIVSPYPVAKEQRARRRLQALRIRRKLWKLKLPTLHPIRSSYGSAPIPLLPTKRKPPKRNQI